jgi:O-antigen ligase/tetratricopeptide (TPR) repeat protein
MNVKTIARWTVLIALFVIPFLALYVDNTLFFPFIAGKGFAFRMLAEIAAAGWLVLAFADKKYRPRFSWILLFYGLFTVWMFIADILAVNPHKALWSNYERMDGWVTIIHLFLFFIAAGSVLGADKLWRKWWLAFNAASALVCGYALLQMTHVLAIHQGSTRLDATLGNSEYLAGYLLFCIATTLWLAFDYKEKKERWLRYLLFALSIVQLVVLVGTGTRGTLIGFVVAAAFGVLLWLFTAGKNGRRGAAAALVALVIIVGGFLAVQHQPFITQNPVLSRFSSISISDLSVRFTIWHMAWQGIQEKPIAGWGQEGFNYVFNTFYDPSLYGQEPWFDRVHNLYLDWTIAGGFPALLLFLLLFGSAIYGLYRGGASRAERILVLSAFVAYGVQGLVVFDNLFTYIPLVALFAFAHTARSRPIAALENKPEVGSALGTVVLPVTGVVLLLALWFVNMPGILGGKDLIKALSSSDANAELGYFKQAIADGTFGTQEVREQMLQFASSAVNSQTVPNDTKEEIASYAADQMKQELVRAPHDARLLTTFAMFYRSVGDYKDALAQSALAAKEAPTKQSILLELGLEQWQDNDLAGARATFERTYQLDTQYDTAAAYDAAGHIITNDVAGGKALLQAHFGSPLVDQPILVPAYYQIKDWNDLIATLALAAKDKGDAASSFQLAAAYAEEGEKAKAIEVFRDTIAAHPDAAAQGNAFISQLGG